MIIYELIQCYRHFIQKYQKYFGFFHDPPPNLHQNVRENLLPVISSFDKIKSK